MNRIYEHFHGGRTGVALLILRSIIGLAFIFHGIPKITDVSGFASNMGLPWILALCAALAEVGGGVLLILGLFTPLAAAALVVQMLTALFMVHFPAGDPFVSNQGSSWELAAVYLCAMIAFLLTGPGLYSVDAMLWGALAAPRRERGLA